MKKGQSQGQRCRAHARAGSAYCGRHKAHDVPPARTGGKRTRRGGRRHIGVRRTAAVDCPNPIANGEGCDDEDVGQYRDGDPEVEYDIAALGCADTGLRDSAKVTADVKKFQAEMAKLKHDWERNVYAAVQEMVHPAEPPPKVRMLSHPHPARRGVLTACLWL